MLKKIGRKITKLFKEPDVKNPFLSKKDINRFVDYFNWNTLSSFISYQTFDEKNKIFINRDSMGFVIESMPILGSDDALQREMAGISQEIMEEGSSCQFLLFADHRTGDFLDRWKEKHSSLGGIYDEMAKKRTDYYKKSQNFSMMSPRIFRCIISYSVAINSIDETSIKKLVDTRNKLIKLLSSFTHSFVWDVSNLLQTLDGIINFDSSSEMKQRKYNNLSTISSQLPLGGKLRIEEDGLSWDNGEKFKSYRVSGYPDYWSLNSMSKLIGDLYRRSFCIKEPFIIHYGIHLPFQAKAETDLKRKMHLTEQQGRSALLMRMIPELKNELREFDFFRKRLQEADKIVWTQLSIGFWSKNQDIGKSEQIVKAVFRSNQFMLQENKYLHLPHFLSCLPMGWGEYVYDLKKLNVLKTACGLETGNLLPLVAEWWGTCTPGMLLAGRRGQMFCWHPFDNTTGNYNVVVAGRSGSGKSVFMQDLLMSSLSLGAQVFVMDVGKSFEKMCLLLEGQFIEFSQSSELCLNPFTYISQIDSEEREASFSMLKAIISTMAAPVRGTDDYENALIEKAIKAAWKKKKNKATITDVSLWLTDHEDNRAVSLGTMLMPYTKEGIYSKYFEGENNVSFDKAMVVVELEELKEKKDLQIVVLQVAIMTITNKIFLGDRKIPFHICIDEAWDLLRGAQTGVFIETLARRLRKYNGSLIIGTQSVDDFYATKGSLAAFENSDWMCLLSQKKSSIIRFKESGKVDMDEEKQRALESISSSHGEYSEVMICDSEGFYAIGRLFLDEFSLLLYSTQAKDYATLKELQKEGSSISQAISKLIKDKKVKK